LQTCLIWRLRKQLNSLRMCLCFHINCKLYSGVGLGYIKLGQSSTTLSGGESQRIKITRELSKNKYGHVVYMLDEPTTGLHFDDTKRLIQVLNRLVEKGNTVYVIEHNLDVVKSCDILLI